MSPFLSRTFIELTSWTFLTDLFDVFVHVLPVEVLLYGQKCTCDARVHEINMIPLCDLLLKRFWNNNTVVFTE